MYYKFCSKLSLADTIQNFALRKNDLTARSTMPEEFLICVVVSIILFISIARLFYIKYKQNQSDRKCKQYQINRKYFKYSLQLSMVVVLLESIYRHIFITISTLNDFN